MSFIQLGDTTSEIQGAVNEMEQKGKQLLWAVALIIFVVMVIMWLGDRKRY